MKFSLRSENVSILLLLFVLVEWSIAEKKLSFCSTSNEGNQTLYRKVSGDDGVLICMKTGGQYAWKFLDGSSTYGESFNPAKDCSDVVDNLPEAKDGFYWMKLANEKPLKAWCDTHTDGGGFFLLGMKDGPVGWKVPSNELPVDPWGPPHWSSEYGNVSIQDFAIQISTTKNFEDTKAHWSYRLKTNLFVGRLFGVGSGGCTDIHSGIGNVSYVKDILTETVVNTRFSCPKFGPHTDLNLGWGRMNYCLRNKCRNGYAYYGEVPFKLDNHGSFSYSASSEFSGITHDSTAFVGCDAGECCACFGPKGGRGHYCSAKCKAMNGGTVLTGKVYVWFWIRTRTPQKLWKRCMEFQMKTEAGKLETFHVDRMTDTAHKGHCSEQFQTFLNEGTILVKDKESFDELPPVPGLLSYREDNEKLYVNKGNKWDAIGSEEETNNLMVEFRGLKKNVANVESYMNERLRKLEARLVNIEWKVPYIGEWPSGSYCILENGDCPSGFYTKTYIKRLKFGSRIRCRGGRCGRIGGHWNADLYINACCK